MIMPNKIETLTTANAGAFVNVTFETYKRIDKTSQFDKFLVIPEGYAYRPDLVSNRVFGYPDSWWLIMEVNNIYDIKDFVAGRTIRIPNQVL
jgi:hypothetical protein